MREVMSHYISKSLQNVHLLIYDTIFFSSSSCLHVMNCNQQIFLFSVSELIKAYFYRVYCVLNIKKQVKQQSSIIKHTKQNYSNVFQRRGQYSASISG